jgi:hypothetical protein
MHEHSFPTRRSSDLLLSVYLHGAAADELLEQTGGPVGITASEITDSARKLLNKFIEQSGLITQDCKKEKYKNYE